MMKLLSAIFGALLVLAASPALAAEWPDNPDQLGGTWSMDGLTEGSPSCSFQLGVNETLGGWTLHFPPNCRREFPVEQIVAWRVDAADGAIIFFDSERKTVFRFDRADDGAYVAHPEGAPGMVIAKGDSSEQRPPTPQEAMTGVWRISALGVAPLCAFDLTSDERGKAGTVTVRPGCGTEWRDRGFARWRMNGDTIYLLDGRDREIISFKRLDLFTFEKRASRDPYSQRGEIMFFGKVFD